MPLTDTAVRNAKPAEKPYKLFDGAGLFLLVTPAGGRLWRLKYRYGGREKLLALGKYPLTGLKKARAKAFEAKQQIEDGIDPSAARKADKARHGSTFELVAREWHQKQAQSWAERSGT